MYFAHVLSQMHVGRRLAVLCPMGRLHAQVRHALSGVESEGRDGLYVLEEGVQESAAAAAAPRDPPALYVER